MSSFWKHKPLIVQSNISFGTMMDKNKLISQIQNDIDSSKIDLDYGIIEMTEECIESILVFINTNYITRGSTITLNYSKDLYKYFCGGGDTICIAFYPKQKRNMVGFIVGKLIQVDVKGVVIDTLEVNFLCLLPQLRSMHVSSYMISILSKVCLMKFNVVSAVYTVGKKLAIPSFCTKHYYHRPLNITKMIDTGLISKSYDTKVARKVYGTFNYKKGESRRLEYYNNSTSIPDRLLSEITEKLMSYTKNTFAIFDIKSQMNIRGFFNNQAFYTFIFKDETGCITDMVTIYKLDTVDVRCGKSCRNGYVYCYFFDKNETLHKFDIMERISEYCKHNDLFDMITIIDCFGLGTKEYSTYKFLKGSGSLHYYFYNGEMFNVDPEKNGLVTI
jgi:hypothetical protein